MENPKWKWETKNVMKRKSKMEMGKQKSKKAPIFLGKIGRTPIPKQNERINKRSDEW